jgi:ketosteroid isomerase-like protein
MLRAIVASQVRKGYGRVSTGRFDELLEDFADDAVFQMMGEHQLGGERRGKAAIREWFDEMHRLFPDLKLEPITVVASGPPWNIHAATRFRVTSAQANYVNEGMQFMHLRWAKVVEDRLFEDTQLLAEAIERQSAAAGARA